MTRDAYVIDRLDLLREVDQIATDLILFELVHGPRADGDELRQRFAAMRVRVLEQMRMMRAAETVH